MSRDPARALDLKSKYINSHSVVFLVSSETKRYCFPLRRGELDSSGHIQLKNKPKFEHLENITREHRSTVTKKK